MGMVSPVVRSRRAAAIAPLSVAGAALAGLVAVRASDPATSRWYLRCPLHEMTGLWCPGCGSTRGVHKALHGDVLGALGSNAFLPVFVTLAVVGWLTWFLPTIGRRPPALVARVPAWGWAALGTVLLAFAVARNLPGEPFRALAP
jgi:Protein of unknown function (DUF2752)